MNPYHVLARALSGPLTLTHAEAAALSPHAELLADLRLVTADSRFEPGGRLAIGVLGIGLLSQLSDVHVRQDPASWRDGYRSGYAEEPSGPPPAGVVDPMAWSSGRVEGAAHRLAGRPSEVDPDPAPGM
jgi:hypothetical protein